MAAIEKDSAEIGSRLQLCGKEIMDYHSGEFGTQMS